MNISIVRPLVNKLYERHDISMGKCQRASLISRDIGISMAKFIS